MARTRGLFGSLSDWAFGYDYFISYAHGDAEHYAEALKNDLVRAKFRVFLDKEVYGPGTDLPKATLRRVLMSKALVLVGSDASFQSEWVQREVEAFVVTGKTPVVLNVSGALQRATATSELARKIIDADWIWYAETPRGVPQAPSPEAVDAIVTSFRSLRRDQVRIKFFQGVAAVFAVLFVLTALGGWQAWLQREKARHNFSIALDGIDAMLGELADEAKHYENVPTEIIAGVLIKAETLVQALDREDSEPRTQLRLATARSALSQIYRRLGRTKQALTQGQKAVDRLTKLKANPANADRKEIAFEYIWATIRLGEAHNENSSREHARKNFEAAIAFNGVDGDRSLTPRLKRALARAHEHLGDLLLARTPEQANRENPMSTKHYTMAFRLLKEALAEITDTPQNTNEKIRIRQSLARMSISLGDLALTSGQFPKALPNYEAARQMAEALVRDDEANISYRRLLVTALQRTAQMGLPEKERVARLEQAHHHALRLRSSNPENTDLSELYAFAAQSLADTLPTSGNEERVAELRSSAARALEKIIARSQKPTALWVETLLEQRFALAKLYVDVGKREPAQLTIASFDVLLRRSEQCSYDDVVRKRIGKLREEAAVFKRQHALDIQNDSADDDKGLKAC